MNTRKTTSSILLSLKIDINLESVLQVYFWVWNKYINLESPPQVYFWPSQKSYITDV